MTLTDGRSGRAKRSAAMLVENDAVPERKKVARLDVSEAASPSQGAPDESVAGAGTEFAPAAATSEFAPAGETSEFAPTGEVGSDAAENPPAAPLDSGLDDTAVLAAEAAAHVEHLILQGMQDSALTTETYWTRPLSELPGARGRLHVSGLSLRDMLAILGKPSHVVLRVFHGARLEAPDETASQFSLISFEKQLSWASIATTRVDVLEAAPGAACEFFEISLADISKKLAPLVRSAKTSIAVVFYDSMITFRSGSLTVKIPLVASVQDTLAVTRQLIVGRSGGEAEASIECEREALDALCAFASKAPKEGGGGLADPLEIILYSNALLLRCGDALSLVINCLPSSTIDGGGPPCVNTASSEREEEDVVAHGAHPTHKFTAPTLGAFTSLLCSGRLWLRFCDCEVMNGSGTRTATCLELQSSVNKFWTRTCYLQAIGDGAQLN